MVQKVTVHDFDGAAEIGAGVVSLGDCQLGVVVGNKRKKMGNITNNVSYLNQGQDQDDIIMPDWNPSSSCVSGGIDPFTLITADGNDDDDTLLSAAAGDAADPLPDLAISSSSSAPLPDLAMSTADVMAPSSPKSSAAADVAPSSSNGGGDDTFVDDLFQAFADEESLDDAGLLQDEAAAPSSSTTPTSNTTGNKNNNVCPKLMKRIEDSLSTIPQEMHELVAKKLIDAISDTKPIVEGASSLFSQGQGGVATAVGGGGNSQVGRRSRSNSGSSECSFKKKATDRSVSVDSESTGTSSSTSQPSIPLPIAVSALKTILAEYGVKVECKMDATATRRGSSCSKDADPRFNTKSSLLPVVPMHA